MKKPEPVTLKKAEEADAHAFLAMGKKMAGKTYVPQTKEQISGDNTFLYVIKAGEKTLGYIYYKVKEGGVIYLGGLMIDLDYQGKGFGREALREFISMVKNAPKIELITHPENQAVGLYESLGFKITERKENYFGDGEPRIVLALEHPADTYILLNTGRRA